MISQTPWGPEWTDAVSRSLAPGETLVGQTNVYTEQYQQVWNDFLKIWQNKFVGFDWMSVALTNINVRFIRFQTERVKTGFLSSEVRSVPQLYVNQAVPIHQITSFGTRKFIPQTHPYKTLKKQLGVDPGEVVAINLVYAGGVFDVASPYFEFDAIAQSIQSAMAGTAIAKQAESVADAVSRLAELLRDGMLTQDEFDRAKQGFVGVSMEVAESSAALIRQMYQLQQAGVLTEGEFRIKKWDILSRSK